MVLFTPALFFLSFSLSYLLITVILNNYSVHFLFIFGSVLDPVGVSDASVAVRAASAARQGVGGVVQLCCGEGGGRGVGGSGGGESAGFTCQGQLPQGIQGIHLSSP